MQFYFDTFPVIEEAAAECERNIEMINYMNNLIDKVGLDYIQSIIDRMMLLQLVS